MFFGSYAHSLDDKNRLVIPSKMRSEIGSRLYIMKGFDGALSVYTEKGYEKLAAEFEKYDFNTKVNRSYLRAQFFSAEELVVDNANRVILPGKLLEKYNISKTVVVAGAGDHIEIWDSKAYEVYMEEANNNFEDNAENLVAKVG